MDISKVQKKIDIYQNNVFLPVFTPHPTTEIIKLDYKQLDLDMREFVNSIEEINKTSDFKLSVISVTIDR